MPLLKFDLIEGRTPNQIEELLNAAHEAIIEAFSLPRSDRYQCVTQHRPGELVLKDTGLGFTRSTSVVLLTVISRKRSEENKLRFYSLLARYLEERCGIAPRDLIVSIVENGDADWSFGGGIAQFITGDL